jgi:RNA polymerase sigma factor (sigma-70 family)
VNRETPPSGLTHAQQKLAAKYLALALAMARPLKRAWPTYGDDFTSAAQLALVEAAQTFDPSRNVKFSTFVMIRIKGALLDMQRDLIKTHCQTNIRIPPADFRKTWRGDGMGRILWTQPDPRVGQLLEVTEFVEHWLKKLPKRHAQACRLTYIDGMNQAEAAETLGCSKSRMSYLQSQSVAMLKESWQAAEIGKDGNKK